MFQYITVADLGVRDWNHPILAGSCEWTVSPKGRGGDT